MQGADSNLARAIGAYLERVDAETVDVDEFVAAVPGFPRAVVDAFLAHELGLERLEPGGFVYDRFALFRALRAAHRKPSSPARTPSDATRLVLGDARFLRLACSACAATAWRAEAAHAACGNCGAALPAPAAVREVHWPAPGVGMDG